MRRIAAVAVGASALLGGLASAAPASADVPVGPQNTPAGPWQVTKDGMGTPLGEFQLPSPDRQMSVLPPL